MRDWLVSLMACKRCGAERMAAHTEGLFCGTCGHGYPVAQGVVQALARALLPAFEQQQVCWRLLERARGIDRPTATRTQALFDWLRRQLRRRGCCRVLELGAGRGWAAHALAGDGHDVIATDILDDGVIGLGRAAKLQADGPWFGCVRSAAEELPFRSESFDCVFCFTTLQHVLDLERAIREAARVLKPGGLFFAFEERFRGILSTPAQARTFDLARTLATQYEAEADPQRLKAGLVPQLMTGHGPFEEPRRVPLVHALATAAGLRTTILPAEIAQALPADSECWNAADWLGTFAAHYQLDESRLRSWVNAARHADGPNLQADLLAYWLLVGNLDGIVLAEKRPAAGEGWPAASLHNAVDCRQIEPLLLHCSRDGTLPVYGVSGPLPGHGFPVRWLAREAGLLVPCNGPVQLGITCLPEPLVFKPLRVEVRINDAAAPLFVVAVRPGMTATLRVPLDKTAVPAAVLLRLRLSATVPVRGSGSEDVGDVWVYAAHCHSTRVKSYSEDEVAAALNRPLAA